MDGRELALRTLAGEEGLPVPAHFFNIMEHGHIERLAGAEPGDYRNDPHGVYLRMIRACHTCSVDQYLAENPLSMGDTGYEGATHGATTGAEAVVVDGIAIHGADDVAHHMEAVVFPALRSAADQLDEEQRTADVIAHEADLQRRLGDEILKLPYGHGSFPYMAYGTYGYGPYLEAWALYPEVMERHFALQADVAVRNNRAVAEAFRRAGSPLVTRLDHDMADARGPLVSPASLERLWYPHFARSIEPLLAADVRCVWHCDGNVMPMVDPLIACGISGFQGFQYECGVDYPALCRRTDRQGRSPLIWAGVSVTTTLPFGTPAQVRDEMRFLIDHGPRAGLFLAHSSSLAPGAPWRNVAAYVEGLRHYREAAR
jgi:hypothetical protein